jgi:uncharacterized protein YbaP (TraB family)
MKVLKILIVTIGLSLLALANQNIENPFLWEVKKGSQQFYLFGTMHLADPKLQILPNALKRAIDRSTIVRTEVAMDMHTQLKSSSLMRRDDGKRLEEILMPKLYRRVETHIKKINPSMSLAPFQHMKIWAVSTIVTMLENQLKYPNMRSIDKVIFDYAKSQKKDVDGVETIEGQLGLMDKFTLREQILGLESSLDQLDKKIDATAMMKAYYMEGDTQAMLRFIQSMMFQMPKYRKLEEKFMQILLYNRNIQMARSIEKIVTKKTHQKSLFAFGVMHFLGQKSVIAILKRDGYRVRRVE